MGSTIMIETINNIQTQKIGDIKDFTNEQPPISGGCCFKTA